MFKALERCEAIKEYKEYTIEELKRLRARLTRECNGYFPNGMIAKIIIDLFTSYSEIVALENRYKKELDRLEFEINTRNGVYDFYSLEGDFLDDVIRSDFMALQKYKLPINYSIGIEVKNSSYGYDIIDVKNAEVIILEIKKILNIYKFRKYLKLDVFSVAQGDPLAVDIYYRVFNKRVNI